MVQLFTRFFTIEFPHLLSRSLPKSAAKCGSKGIKQKAYKSLGHPRGTGALIFDDSENLLRVIPPLYHLEEVYLKARLFHEAVLAKPKAELARVEFLHHSPEALSAILAQYFKDGAPLPNMFDPKVAQVSGLSTFQSLCFKQTSIIPLGETRPYHWITQKLHKPKCERAVGTVLKSNPFPLFVPCHRVIKKDGALGGFMGSHSPETWRGQLKKILLELEGFHRQPSLFGNHGFISLENFN